VRKRILSITAALMVLTTLIVPVNAADTEALSDPDALLPVDIIIDQENREIRKVYDLSPNTDPSTLPMEAFERDGLRYDCTDILREVIIGSETQTVKQTETVESEKKDLESVLELLPQEREITTEEGFSGTVRLNLDSIETKPSAYGSSTRPVTVTRSYPNLSDADINHLPKSVSDSGMTLALQDVQWQTDNTYNADDYEIGDRFTAICTYGGTKTTSYVKTYTTTADYEGEVYRTGVTVIRYTVIYTGTPLEPVEQPETSEQPGPDEDIGIGSWLPALLFALAGLGLGTGGTYYFLTKRKEQTDYETMDPVSRDDADPVLDDDDAGTGDGTGASD